MDLTEKLAKATEYKTKGNQHFKTGNHKSALSSYNFAYLYVKGLDSDLSLAGLQSSSLTPAQKSEIHQLTVSILNNTAMCLLSMSRFQDCVNQCEKVLKLESDNCKAIFRMAMAISKQPNPDLIKSKDLLINAVKLNPNDTGIRTELENVTSKLAELNKKSKMELKQNLQKSLNE